MKVATLTRWMVGTIVSLGPVGIAQQPKPTIQYELHAGKTPHVGLNFRLTAAAPPPTISASADKELVFALIPQERQGWQLQEIREWSTPAPKIRTLNFVGAERDDRQDFITGSLTPTQDGKFLLARILIYDLEKYERSAVVVLVDLEKFEIVSRSVTADPLVANSQWRFTSDGSLLAVEGPPPSFRSVHKEYILPDVMQMNPLSLGEHEAAILRFPDLEPVQRCLYSVQNTDSSPHKYEILPISEDCRVVFAVSGVKTGSELISPRDAGRHFAAIKQPSCELEAYNTDSSEGLYACWEGQMLQEYFQISKRTAEVRSTVGGASILSVPIKKNDDVSATLLTREGKSYLFLLHDGLKVSVYQVP